MAKRSYTSKVRTVAAQETRAAVLRAARQLFEEQGYAKTTVAGIAEQAGVALNTVYTSVGGKPGLLAALVAESADDALIQSTLDDVLGSSDGRDILHRTAEGTGTITRQHETILNLLHDNANADPVVTAAAESADKIYRARLEQTAQHLVTLNAVRTDQSHTADILWFYFGRSGWRAVRELGWDWPECTTWLTDQASSALLPR
ncbi:TetR/AcrR family transcriptional regulator [Kribbella antibiotica]|uniref:TetR/AcrR family transcriptional regulator n=1 Tax=Kribbella antibiotica TaxID=190195 RepID=A0A4R4ZN31_9ACTN|nr:TetR/AcrR family transcriptional regulator [Kribbella antibiotica]TDD60268.1 TetR/AcrR family transcriptional regulator [Kribbella antibiotica]